MNFFMFSAFAIYFSIIGVIGFLAYLRSTKTGDFALGGRSLNYWVTALATHASDMSGWLFMGFPATIYAAGLLEAWVAIGLTGFMLLSWILVAPALRRLTAYHNVRTLSSFFEKRFNDSSGMLRIISALFCLLFFTFYISANFAVLGHLFESIFGLNYLTGIIIGFFIVFYVLLGGFLSIAWIDCFQGIFLFLAIILVPVVAFFHVGGFAAITSSALTRGISLTLIPHTWNDFVHAFILTTGWGLGYFGQPHIITKFMGIDNPDNIKKARYVGISWQLITMTAAVFVGIVGIAFFPRGLENNELIFIEMTKHLFHPFVAGLILCSIIASAINVTGAQVLSSASVIAEDFYKRWVNSKSSNEKSVTRASRIGVLVICAGAFLIAYANPGKKIFDLVQYAWTGLGATFGPLVLIALHTKVKSRYAALAGIIVGGVGAGLLPYSGLPLSAAAIMVLSFAASAIVIMLVDRMHINN
jgi:sodium/proline symporter